MGGWRLSSPTSRRPLFQTDGVPVATCSSVNHLVSDCKRGSCKALSGRILQRLLRYHRTNVIVYILQFLKFIQPRARLPNAGAGPVGGGLKMRLMTQVRNFEWTLPTSEHELGLKPVETSEKHRARLLKQLAEAEPFASKGQPTRTRM